MINRIDPSSVIFSALTDRRPNKGDRSGLKSIIYPNSDCI